MKFVEPKIEYWQQEAGMQGVWKQIARATRVCYQSRQRDNETDEEFVKRVIFKPALVEGELNDLANCKFDILKLHGGCLEHGTAYLAIPWVDNRGKVLSDECKLIAKYENSPYSRTADIPDDRISYITTNLRVIAEYNRWKDLKYLCEPTKCHDRRYTFDAITDIGVTREMNRHRTFSIAEMSTRYCDFNKDKFGGELTFIEPNWKVVGLTCQYFGNIYKKIEDVYQYLRKLGWKPEQARQVLPLGLKTEAVYTAFADDWKHFLRLRADNASGKAHPNINLIANMIKKEMANNNLN